MPTCPDSSTTLSPRQDSSSRSIWLGAVAIFAATCFARRGLYYIGCQYCTGEREFLPDGEIALASFCCRGAAAMALL